ncbi:uncharacterized protein LOC122513561 [Polistes fuscatus]|uniref:uncharacterized protein LOC122513561 n=1 Tax=Polistes fuscatus TaxID=30207 RepID=UPI001CA98851|nr:uncharacterized protein LOC122513561 [Polistes fuscatus]
MKSVKRLRRERKILKGRLTSLENLVGEGKSKINELVNRYERLTKLIEEYERSYRDCVDISPEEEEEFNDLENLFNRYHTVGSIIDEKRTPAANIANDSSITSNQTSTTERQIKLKRIEIPRFDGKLEEWLEFKKGFLTLIDARTDISDLEKHAYLRDALHSRALEVIKLYSVDGSNNNIAWETLLEKYDRKRVLLARLLDAILDLKYSANNSARGI